MLFPFLSTFNHLEMNVHMIERKIFLLIILSLPNFSSFLHPQLFCGLFHFASFLIFFITRILAKQKNCVNFEKKICQIKRVTLENGCKLTHKLRSIDITIHNIPHSSCTFYYGIMGKRSKNMMILRKIAKRE